MQLYTKIRATKKDGCGIRNEVEKGQGSNEQLNIDININGEEKPRYKIFITVREDSSTDFVLVDMEKPFPNEIYSETIKGKRQKGETWGVCKVCKGKNTCLKDRFCETIPN